ncbi:MAG TPA: LysR family transcriptional regulator [Candidatus Salinicoccus stercoripullorum]|uniref:LysR family transcriptional regulator n=1 Tax=Candidatus Salinicoccus stercoripullorum TaxID=2838756 RepID=A0A9D1U0G8_9STAP|nr:LysR family transcriptional regulator [Candidatus Salinicoccus stercoripullorum]
MEIKQLKYFVETARQEHMTEAAMALNVAQSALSRQISLLENELEIELFRREGRNIKLTEGGRSFYEDAVQILESVEKTKERIIEARDRKENSFNIHITRSDMTAKVLQSFNYFIKQEEAIEFTIHSESEATLGEKLLEASLDLVISPQKFNDDELRSTLLFEQNYYYVFRQKSGLSLPVQASASELEGLPLATFDPVIEMDRLFRSSRIYNYKDLSIIQHLLINHGYIAIVTSDEARQLIYNYPNFTVHSLKHLNIKHPMYASMHKDNGKPFVGKWYSQLRQEFTSMHSSYPD